MPFHATLHPFFSSRKVKFMPIFNIFGQLSWVPGFFITCFSFLLSYDDFNEPGLWQKKGKLQLQKSKIHFSGPTLTAPNSALPVLKWPCKDIGGILSVSKCTCKMARSYFSSRAIERQIIKLFIEFFHVLVEYHESLESTDWSIESTSAKAKQQAKHNTKG